jgi:hypothetical protein
MHSARISKEAFYHLRPTLDDILADKAPYPYTLGAFIAYLSENRCLETLEFILQARRYQDTCDWYYRRFYNSETAADDLWVLLCTQWRLLLTTYIFPGAPREINISSEIRVNLLQEANITAPPPPQKLDTAVQHTCELLGESVLIPFLRSCSAAAHIQSLSEPSLRVPRQGMALVLREEPA